MSSTLPAGTQPAGLPLAGAPRGLAWRGSGGLLRRAVMPQSAWFVLAVVVGFLVLWPILQLQARAFSEGGSAFARMAELPHIGQTAWTTVLLAVFSSAIAVVLGTALAWCASLLPRKLQLLGEVGAMLPLLVPAVAAVTGWIFLLSPRVGYINTLLRMTPFFSGLDEGPMDIYSVKWIVFITGLLMSSFVFMFVHTALKNMGQELDAAAATCGASPVRRLFTVTLPLLRPSIVFASGTVFLLGMGQFTAPLLLGRGSNVNVLITEMFRLTQEYPIDYALGAALGFPILIAGLGVVLIQKLMLGEQRRFVVVSGRSRYQVRETRWWATAVIAIYLLITTILPLLALVYVSLTPFWSGRLDVAEFTLRHWKTALANPVLINGVWTSVKTSLLAILILLPLGFAMAFGLLSTTRVLRPARLAIDFLATLPLAVPASLMGFGLLFAYTRPPFQIYGTAAVLVVTYVTLMVGNATRLQFTTLVSLGQEFHEASRACGAGALRSLTQVLLPLCRKGIAAAAALMFVLLFHEFSASLMVRSSRTQVIGSLMYDVFTGGLYPEVAVLALVMVFVTVVGVLAAVLIGGADSLKKLD